VRIARSGATRATEDAPRNVIHAAQGELIALIAVDDLVVVRAGKALLT
jgi:mannose-1-phosphate guanylyltransferase